MEAKAAPKSLQNGGRNRLENAVQRAWKRKWRKCDFEQRYSVLARFLVSWGLGNQKKKKKNSSQDRIKVQRRSWNRFWMDFGRILEAMLDAKSHQNLMKN